MTSFAREGGDRGEGGADIKLKCKTKLSSESLSYKSDSFSPPFSRCAAARCDQVELFLRRFFFFSPRPLSPFFAGDTTTADSAGLLGDRARGLAGAFFAFLLRQKAR